MRTTACKRAAGLLFRCLLRVRPLRTSTNTSPKVAPSFDCWCFGTLSHEVLPKRIIEAVRPLKAYYETMGAKPRAEDGDEMNWHAVAGR